MSAGRRILLSAVAIAAVAAMVAIWIVRGPGPMAFADGQKVALADYRAGDPTGVVPASLRAVSVISPKNATFCDNTDVMWSVNCPSVKPLCVP